MGWDAGLEPVTPGTTNQCSNQLSYFHRENPVNPAPNTEVNGLL